MKENILSKDELSKLSKDDLIKKIEFFQNNDRIVENLDDKININYKELLEATSDIMFVLNKESKIVFHNTRWKTIFPFMKNINIGDSYIKYISEERAERANEIFETILNEGTDIVDELIMLHDVDDNPLYFSASFSPIRSNKDEVVGIFGIMKNVTSRHIMEKKLKENAETLEEKVKLQIKQSEELSSVKSLNEEIIIDAPMGFFMLDPSGIMLSENPTLKKMMGYSNDETMVGLNLLKHNSIVESGFKKLYEECLRLKKAKRSHDTPFVVSKTGKTLYLSVTMKPMYEKSGILKKIIVMICNNTDQVIKRENDYKAEKFSAIGLLATGVASGLRNPINKIAMDLNFVENNTDEDNQTFNYISSIKEELDIIKSISGQLLCLSDPEVKSKTICDLRNLINLHPVDFILKSMKSDGYEVELNVSNDALNVLATENQLKQIFASLITNAFEAMPNLGKLKIEMKKIVVKDEEYGVFIIEDSGFGIPKENLKKIFQPFFSTKGTKANGLGLMITSTVLENLDGSIGIKSELGEGTSVKVAIPLFKSEE